MKLWIAASASVLAWTALPAAAQQSQTTITQSGGANDVTVDQSGAISPAQVTVTQTGWFDRATVIQANGGRAAASGPDIAEIEQSGDRSSATIAQNTLAAQYASHGSIAQGGSDNTAFIQQHGGDHQSMIQQISGNNYARNTQTSDESFGAATYDGNISSIVQAGEGGHLAAVEQIGQHGMSEIVQSGANNMADVMQGNVYSWSSIAQTGSGNTAVLREPMNSHSDIFQHGVNGMIEAKLDGSLRVLQTDTADRAFVKVIQSGVGGRSGATIEQRGGGTAELWQDGGGASVFQQEASTVFIRQGSVASGLSVDQFAGSAGATVYVDQGLRTGELAIQQHAPANVTATQSGLGAYAFISQGAGSDGSRAATYQSGASNSLVLYQRASPGAFGMGPENSSATIDQVGWGNQALAFQQGAGSERLVISQVSPAGIDAGNEVSSWQGGGGYHDAEIRQANAGNFAQVAQGGRPDDSGTPLDPVSMEFGGSTGNALSLNQSGAGNTAVLTQIGSSSSIEGVQSGQGNAAYVLQELGSVGNLTNFDQSGNDNRLDVIQSGFGNLAYLSQVTNGNSLSLNQAGNGNSVTVKQ